MSGSPEKFNNLVPIVITFTSYSLVARLLSLPITIGVVEFDTS
jgi:hypothetical protein